MAIGKNSFKVSRFNSDYHLADKNGFMSSDDEDSLRKHSNIAVESDDKDDDHFDECDSGAGSDDFDLLELGQAGEEFCQVGDQTCSFPYELYDLPGFDNVLSMEVWNEILTEEERFALTKYLPDMDAENFVLTLKELFARDKFHFGSPIDKLFEMLKGGLCEPRVMLYRQGLNFLQRRQHYHKIHKYQNAMVNNLCQMRDVWRTCKGYSIEEKLRVLNIKKCQKSLMNENMEEIGSESTDREEFGDDLRVKRVKGKDGKLVPKIAQYSGYSMGADFDNFTPGLKNVMESKKNGNQKNNKTSKLVGSRTASKKELGGSVQPISSNVEMKSRRYSSGFPDSCSKAASHEASAEVRMNEQILENDDEEETEYKVAGHKDPIFQQFGAGNKSRVVRLGKEQEGSRTEEDMESFMGVNVSARKGSHFLGRNKAINQLSDIKVLTTRPSHGRNRYDAEMRLNFPDDFNHLTAENSMKFDNGQKLNTSLKENQYEFLDGRESPWFAKPRNELFPVDLSYKHSYFNAKSKKCNTGKDQFQISSLQNGGIDGGKNRDTKAFALSEETESDSSDQIDDDGDDENPLMRSKWAYPGGVPDLKYRSYTKKATLSRKDKRDSYLSLDGTSQSNRNVFDHGEDLETISSGKKNKMRDFGHLNNLSTEDLHANHFAKHDNELDDDSQQFYPDERNAHIEVGSGNSFDMLSLKSSFAPGRRLKGESRRDYDSACNDDLFWKRPMAASDAFQWGKKNQMVESSADRHPEAYSVPMTGCNTLMKKRKMKDDAACMDLQDMDYLHEDAQLLLDSVNDLRKRGKTKMEDGTDDLENEISEPPYMEMAMEDAEEETKPQKKPFPLITPTILTGFSFSIIHLLSAVRMAMITLLPDDSLEDRNHPDENDAGLGVKEEQDRKQADTNVVNLNTNEVKILMPSTQENLRPLSVQDIVNRIRSNPGDPCILETQEPLQDLLRGVLKIFSSRTAPLGAKGWKPLVIYEKSKKSWSWIGPVSHNSSDSDIIEEVTSPEAWCLPYKMLVKMVDAFANWLKNSQETLQQIGRLPDPPLILMQNNLDEKERFKDLRAQKSLSTITPNPEEVRDYFRKEEVLRYLIPDRAFSYTAVDGKKSTVAPLRRCGGKPTSKARDHFMLKRDRPPHVTILCLVRDAAARLPGKIGTRADVCTLIRDSQYIVEDVADAQINQVVSGALDRLHYERDPCVQFDGERKLWVYLHREREEEDFEDDGTSSTKTWRRQKKEVAEPSDQDADKRSEPDHQNVDGLVEDNAGNSYVSDSCLHQDPPPAPWNAIELNSVKDNRLLCPENSTNENFEENILREAPPA